MFDRVLNMPVDYLSCFAIALRGIHRKVDIWQIDVFVLSFIFLVPMYQALSVISRSGACDFVHVSN